MTDELFGRSFDDLLNENAASNSFYVLLYEILEPKIEKCAESFQSFNKRPK